MIKNSGTLDRAVRVILGLGLLSLTFVGPQTPFAYVGLIPLLTGIMGYCPLYSVVGLNTCSLKKNN